MGEIERRDYYGDLRLPFGASEAVVRQRFKRLAKRYHPDVNPSHQAAEQFRRVREAYEVLTDPARRRVVDSWYTVAREGVHRRYRMDAPAAPPAPDIRTFRAQREANDRLWSFGCFGLLAFGLSLLGFFADLHPSLPHGLLVSALVGAGFGLVAALGGPRVREWLLWLLYLGWP